jgi:NTE family protein
VLKAFREAGIPVDVIAGTSMGAVVGAAYASGYRIDELIDMALEMRWWRLLGLADPKIPRQGVIAGNRLERYFDTLTGGREFNQLEKHLIVVATDIATGEEVRINSGPVARALRASTAVPGIFCPVRSGQRLLVDGTITAPVPAAAAGEAGPAVMVAVDVCSPVDRTDVLVHLWKWWNEIPSRQLYHRIGAPGFLRLLKSAMSESINVIGRSLELYDRYIQTSPPAAPSMHYWLLRPAVEDVKWYEFHRVRECIQAGEAVGRQVADQVNALLETGDLARGTNHQTGRARVNQYNGEEDHRD